MGGMGHLALPWSEALPPHTPLTRKKMAKNQPFLVFYIFVPSTPPHPTPTKNNLVQPLKKSGFKACENIQWCKIHAIFGGWF